MSSHLMVDIETMATTPDAAILSIGACAFDIRGGDIEKEFDITISLESNEQEHRRFSASTIGWWLQQGDEARSALFEKPTNLRNAIKRLRVWADAVRPKITHVWANDPDFDVVILKHAFDQLGEHWPFQFWMNRSVRTIGELAYPDLDERREVMASFRAAGVHHRAVDDAVAQARFVQHCYNLLVLRD